MADFEKFLAYNLLIGSLVLLGNGQMLHTKDLAEEQPEIPLPHCPTYILLPGESVSDGNTMTQQSPEQPIRGSSTLYFYPFTDKDIRLNLLIRTPSIYYKATVDGTMIEIEICDSMNDTCQMENMGGLRVSNFIKPQKWNEIIAHVSYDQITVMVGDRVMFSTKPQPPEILKDAVWSVRATKEGVSYPDENVLFLVKPNCDENAPPPPAHDYSPEHGFPSSDLPSLDYSPSQSPSTSSTPTELSIVPRVGDTEKVESTNPLTNSTEPTNHTEPTNSAVLIGSIILIIAVCASVIVSVLWYIKSRKGGLTLEEKPINQSKGATNNDLQQEQTEQAALP